MGLVEGVPAAVGPGPRPAARAARLDFGGGARCGLLAPPFPRARARAGGACAGSSRGRDRLPGFARRPPSCGRRPSTHGGDGSRASAGALSAWSSAVAARSSVVGSTAARAVPAAASRPGSRAHRSPAGGRRRAGRPAVPRLPIAPGARAPGRRLPAARPCPLKGAGAALRPGLRSPGRPGVRC
jgi:hypothetical protein